MRSIAFSFLVTGVAALNNGVGKLPKMGYNSKFEDPIVLGMGANSSCSLQRIWL
jgi:hypothetical protein